MRARALLLAALLALGDAPDAFGRSHRARAHDADAEHLERPAKTRSRNSHHHRIHRDPAQRREFMRDNPCPNGPDAGSSRRCRGYVVDHIKPLNRGGADRPWSMQWQGKAEARAKDRWE